MSTPTRIRNQLAAFNSMTDNVTNKMPAALASMKQATVLADGFSSTASGRDNGPRGSGGGSSVERAVERRLGTTERHSGPVTDLEDISDYLAAGAVALDNIAKILKRYAENLTEKERKALICMGDGTEGYRCTRWATVKGQCDACRMRARRRELAS